MEISLENLYVDIRALRGQTWVQISNNLYAVTVTLPRISDSDERKKINDNL